eukprot:3960727-Prymnesium_polylepis.1
MNVAGVTVAPNRHTNVVGPVGAKFEPRKTNEALGPPARGPAGNQTTRQPGNQAIRQSSSQAIE